MAILITSVLFFTFIFYQDTLSPIMALYGATPLLLAVYISTFQQFMSKSCKYSLFDPTKEMSYIPLDPVLRSKGKAAVDVTGHLFSKASGGYFTGIILMVTAASDLMLIVPMLAIAVLLTLVLWVWAVTKLNKEYTAMTSEAEETAVGAAAVNTDYPVTLGDAHKGKLSIVS
jgi:AAA family ATP:ADP antiporter